MWLILGSVCDLVELAPVFLTISMSVVKAEEPDWFKTPSPVNNVDEVIPKPVSNPTIPHKRVNTPISFPTPSNEHSLVRQHSRAVADRSDNPETTYKPRKGRRTPSPPAQGSSARERPPRTVKLSKRQKKAERRAQKRSNGVSVEETGSSTRAEEPIPIPPTKVIPATSGNICPEEPAKVDLQAMEGSTHPEEPGPNPPVTPTVASASTKPREPRAGFTNDVVCASLMCFLQVFETNIT